MQKVPSGETSFEEQFLSLTCEIVGADDIAKCSLDSIEHFRYLLHTLDKPTVVRFIGLIDKEALKTFASSLIEAALKNLDIVTFNRPPKLGRILIEILHFFTENYYGFV